MRILAAGLLVSVLGAQGGALTRHEPDTIQFRDDGADLLQSDGGSYLHLSEDVSITIGGPNDGHLTLKTNASKRPPAPPRQVSLSFSGATIESCPGCFFPPNYPEGSTEAQIAIHVRDTGGWFGMGVGSDTVGEMAIFFPDPSKAVTWEIRFNNGAFEPDAMCLDSAGVTVVRLSENEWSVEAAAADEACLMYYSTKGKTAGQRVHRGSLTLPFRMSVRCDVAPCSP